MPNYWCAVSGCTSDKRKQVSRYPFMKDIKFYPFPSKLSNLKLRRRWLDLIRRPLDYEPKSWHSVCSRHFEGSNPLPTLFPWNHFGKLEFRRPASSIKKREAAQKDDGQEVISEDTPQCHASTCVDFPAPPDGNTDSANTIAYSIVPPLVVKEVEVASNTSEDIQENYEQMRRYVEDHTYSNLSAKITMDVSTKEMETQTDLTLGDIAAMEKLRASQENKDSLMRDLFCEKATSCDKNIRYFTGIPTLTLFFGLLNIIIRSSPSMKYWSGNDSVDEKFYENGKRQKPGPKRKLSPVQEFLLSLIRLKLGVPVIFMSEIFSVSQSRVSQIFSTWMYHTSTVLKGLIIWPSRNLVKKHMPWSFKLSFPRTRVIIDCTEFYIQRPRNPTMQSKTYSSYKSYNTYKCLIGITPTGSFSFVSAVWGGNVSDKYITEHSGFLDLISPGDEVMADRGFVIRDLLSEKGAYLIIPPFTRRCTWGKGKRLNAEEIRRTRQIANLRIHVERAIQRLKTFKMLSQVNPWSMRSIVDQMVIVAAIICNLMKPLVK